MRHVQNPQREFGLPLLQGTSKNPLAIAFKK